MSSDCDPHPEPQQPMKKSIMRSLGEFVGHVWWGIRTDPSAANPDSSKRVVERTVREERRGDITLRETTVREIEYRSKSTDENDRGE